METKIAGMFAVGDFADNLGKVKMTAAAVARRSTTAAAIERQLLMGGLERAARNRASACVRGKTARREGERKMGIPVIDADLCSGCGLCETLCPGVFELGDDGLAHVLDVSDCAGANCCEEAAASCPEEAITLED